ncbi:uncharacterized protein UHOD_02339 [Ustilago sp. UG-2017b]|nr:uncharacterized protein UHOD_02339 [Ustilago sp. UG-2017b]
MRHGAPCVHKMRNQPHHGFPAEFAENNHITSFQMILLKSIRIHPSGSFHQMHCEKIPTMCNRSNVHKEGTGELEEKVSIVEGEDKTARRGSHVRNGTKLSKEGDQAQKHAVGYHTGGHVHNHMELTTRETAGTGSRTIRSITWSGDSQDRDCHRNVSRLSHDPSHMYHRSNIDLSFHCKRVLDSSH